MPFGRTKLEKQDLIDAGLDPDKLKEFQEKGVTKDDISTLKAELTASLSTSINDLIKNSFTELETKLRTPGNKDKDGNNNGGEERETVDEQTEFLTDPVGYVNKKTNSVVTAAAIEFKRMSRDLAWKESSRSLRGFNNAALRAEIEEEWKKYSPEKMAQYNIDPSTCLQQIHDMVLGKHHDEVVQDTNKRDGKYNLVHSGAGSSGGNQGAVSQDKNNNNTVQLSDQEKLLAKKFGMTDEEWIKQGEDMDKEEQERRNMSMAGSR